MLREKKVKLTDSELVYIGLTIMLLGVALVSSGSHNIDLCRNEKDISLMYGIDDLAETTATGKVLDLDECYVGGLLRVNVSPYVIIAGSIIFGYNLSKLKNGRVKKRN